MRGMIKGVRKMEDRYLGKKMKMSSDGRRGRQREEMFSSCGSRFIAMTGISPTVGTTANNFVLKKMMQ
ncbi:hypothetical protein L2E82_25756 [Cichorium intybus]|uniref:Uncharacterized protein n=1 Tax=Cichorium intybus TaxID=13427 RepID=A0ACB9E4U5_CICIN|nr:hypothetical protein L2E82_25756 [Cichorium intybus]